MKLKVEIMLCSDFKVIAEVTWRKKAVTAVTA